MKQFVLVVLFGALAIHSARAVDGRITVANTATTPVSNALTGTLVKSTDGLTALLYMAPNGTTDESVFVAIPPSAPFVSTLGRFGSTIRIVTNYPGLTYVNVQVRAFETNYGNTYEQASAAAPMNGRRALVGKSAIATVRLGDGVTAPDSLVGCGPFTVDIAGGGPWLTVGDLVVAEGSNGTVVANFKVSLAATQAQTVTVDFTTRDGTALAGSDYVATSGTISFSPGETLKLVPVTLTPDVPPEPDEYFYLDLSNVANAVLVRSEATCIITEIRITGISVDTAISFNTVANRHYALERTSDLVNWQTVLGATNIAGTGGIVTVIDHGSGGAAGVVYRARLVDP